MNYIQMQIDNQSLPEMGDILQLAILEVFRKKCKQDPTQKAKLLKIIIEFSKNASDSVILECAIALTTISMSSSTLKNALNGYVTILSSHSELNVKKVVLDRIQAISTNSKYLEDVIGDLLKILETPSA
jgi:coatomer subunit beta